MTEHHEQNQDASESAATVQSRLTRHQSRIRAESAACTAGAIVAFILAWINLSSADGNVNDAQFHYGIACMLGAMILMIGAFACHSHHTSTSAMLTLAKDVHELRGDFDEHDDRVRNRLGRLMSAGAHHGEALDQLRVACGDDLSEVRRRNGSHDN